MPEIEILTAQRVVTAAGTPEKIKEAPEFVDNQVIAVEIVAEHDNVGVIYLVNEANRANASTVGRIIPPGVSVWLDVHDFYDGFLDLSKIWIDAANSGDGISYTAFKVIR